MKKFVAVIESRAVRDVQFCNNIIADPMCDEGWEDYPNAEIYLGVYEGERMDVLAQAAADAETDPYNIRLIEI
jgi:hypothetical protein